MMCTSALGTAATDEESATRGYTYMCLYTPASSFKHHGHLKPTQTSFLNNSATTKCT